MKEVLEDTNEIDWIRGCAAISLGRLSGDEVIPQLAHALVANSAVLSRAVIEALRNIHSEQAIALLKGILEDGSKRELHAMTINAIGEIGGRGVASVLIETLHSQDNPVRRRAALTLSGMAIQEAVVPFIELIDDSDECLRAIAASALGLARDKRALKPLVTALADRAETVRTIAASSLGYLGSSKAIEPLEKALGDKCENVRKQAATALSKIGKEQA